MHHSLHSKQVLCGRIIYAANGEFLLQFGLS